MPLRNQRLISVSRCDDGKTSNSLTGIEPSILPQAVEKIETVLADGEKLDQAQAPVLGGLLDCAILTTWSVKIKLPNPAMPRR